MIIIFLNISCTSESLNSATIESLSERFSGKELFSSIIFMDGKATSSFPVLTNNFNIDEYLTTPDEKKEYKNIQIRAIDFIEKNNPNFFDEFQKNMYSQDPIAIKKGLIKSAEVLKPFLNKELKVKGVNFDVTIKNKKNLDEMKSAINKYQKSKKEAKAAALPMLALAVLLAVVAGVAFYVVAISEYWVGTTINNEEKLSTDELARSIATEL